MIRVSHKSTAGKTTGQVTARKTAGQAATELAVFGAILIFVLGAIVRTAYGNAYMQSQNFKAMRMAMLASWNSSLAGSTALSSATILFVEDRLSPDPSKYGEIDRQPFIAQGSGTFTYLLYYPLDPSEVSANLPMMDMYINGQHFPFTTASYVQNKILMSPNSCGGTSMSPVAAQETCLSCVQNPGGAGCSKYAGYTSGQCSQNVFQAQCQVNQCLRNQREWVYTKVQESQFESIVPVPLTDTPSQRVQAELSNASLIFNELMNEGFIDAHSKQGSEFIIDPTSSALVGGFSGNATTQVETQWPGAFQTWFNGKFPAGTSDQFAQIQNILKNADNGKFKLFYTIEPNGVSQFNINPPTCASPNTTACKDEALSNTLQVQDAFGHSFTNTNGEMQYDLLRLGDYSAVDNQFPPSETCSTSTYPAPQRCNIAWQWAATAATSGDMVGLAPPSAYPPYDIDGSLKMVNIYSLTQNSDGTPTVSYEDPAGGDLDLTWDSNSCSPLKPGMQTDSQIYTFTKDGTYLQIKEGKLYNPETDQFVRSENRHDSIDLVQRMIILSNDTGRFCDGKSEIPPAYLGRCVVPPNCTSYATCNCVPQGGTVPMIYDSTPNAAAGETSNYAIAPNPVEVCIYKGDTNNCFSSQTNIKSTCYDENTNTLYVRSRLEDRRGHFWATDTSGPLQVK